MCEKRTEYVNRFLSAMNGQEIVIKFVKESPNLELNEDPTKVDVISVASEDVITIIMNHRCAYELQNVLGNFVNSNVHEEMQK